MVDETADGHRHDLVDVHVRQERHQVDAVVRVELVRQRDELDRLQSQVVAERGVAGDLHAQQEVRPDALEGRLREIYQSRANKTMFVMGDGSLRYGKIIEALDAAKGAGVERVGIVTEGMRRAAATNPRLPPIPDRH